MVRYITVMALCTLTSIHALIIVYCFDKNVPTKSIWARKNLFGKSVTLHHCREVKTGIGSKLINPIHSQEQNGHSLWCGQSTRNHTPTGELFSLPLSIHPPSLSPLLLSYQEPITPTLMVGPEGPFTHPWWNFYWLDLVKVCAGP